MLRNCAPHRTPSRRPVAAAALGAYLLAAVGVPLPASPTADVGPPFPCQDHGCGCKSAEQCWRHCCCFTPEQRWAWAAARGVEPPAYATKPAPGSWRTQRLRDREAAADRPARSCCSGHGGCADRPHDHRPLRLPTVSPLRCRGLTAAWAAVATGVVPPPALTGRGAAPIVATLALPHDRPHLVSSAPPTPPPRPV